MKFKKKKFLISFIALLLLLSGVNFVLAANGSGWRLPEIEYPKVPFPGVETPNEFIQKIREGSYSPDQALPLYIKYFYSLALTLSGLIVFGAILYGGFKYLTAFDKPERISDARETISGAILGLLILLFTHLILVTLNPQLVILDIVLPATPVCDCSLPSAALTTHCKNVCYKPPPRVVEGDVYIQIPLGRIIERVIKQSDVTRLAAEEVKIMADPFLIQWAQHLKRLIDNCICSNARPDCIGCPETGPIPAVPPECETPDPVAVALGLPDADNYTACGCSYLEECQCTECIAGDIGEPTPKVISSKLGFQTEFAQYQDDAWRFITNAQPAVVKLLSNYGEASRIKSISPGTFIVGRICCESIGEEKLSSDDKAIEEARDWFNRHKATIESAPMEIDCWEGPNEPIIFNEELMRRYALYESERVRLLASIGRRACIGTFSVGLPEYNLWDEFLPAIETAQRFGGFLNLHEYSAPTMHCLADNKITTTGVSYGDLLTRYRWLYEELLKPRGLVIPLIISETGIDAGICNFQPTCGCASRSGEENGWRNYTDAERYIQELAFYDSKLMEDDYVLGAAIFSLGLFDWESFDLHGQMVDLLINYIGSGVVGGTVSYPRCDVCPPDVRRDIISTQRSILNYLSRYRAIRYMLAYETTMLENYYIDLRLAEAMIRDSISGTISATNFSGPPDVQIKKISHWADIDINYNYLLEQEDTADPAIFYISEDGNEDLIRLVESVAAPAPPPPIYIPPPVLPPGPGEPLPPSPPGPGGGGVCPPGTGICAPDNIERFGYNRTWAEEASQICKAENPSENPASLNDACLDIGTRCRPEKGSACINCRDGYSYCDYSGGLFQLNLLVRCPAAVSYQPENSCVAPFAGTIVTFCRCEIHDPALVEECKLRYGISDNSAIYSRNIADAYNTWSFRENWCRWTTSYECNLCPR